MTGAVSLMLGDTICLSFKNVKDWALRVMRRFRLGGYIILKSSEGNYHVVFDRKVTWSENMDIVAWASPESRNKELVRWLQMQCKQSSTLRVSPKKDKSSPRVVYRHGNQDGQIRGFLDYRQMMKGMIQNMNESERTLYASHTMVMR